MQAQYICEIRLREPVDPRSYLAELPAVKHLAENGLSLQRPITILVGENGTGKSTLLEAVAVAYGFNSEGGTRNFDFATRESHSDLYRHIAIARRAFPKDGFFLRAESLYNVATEIDNLGITGAYGGVSLHEHSHGESVLSVLQNRFRGSSLYILDEPETALSPMRVLTLIAEIDRLVRADSQFLIATHSPMLMAIPNAQIFHLSAEGIREIPYTETEHFQLAKSFLNNPERILRILLKG